MLTAVALAALLSASSGQCTAVQIAAGLCSITNTGTSVDIGGSRPGGDRGENGGGDRGGDSSDRSPEEESAPEAEECILNRCDILYEVELLRDVTLTDLASFAPSGSPLSPEPAGIGIVGMPLNVVVAAHAHSVTGELFDLPVTVRFVPVSYRFDYGDGASREATTGGDSWAELGQAQFTPTATSHAYAARGTYAITGTVHYAAAVDFGGGWIPVAGRLGIPTAGTSVEVVEVRTALVDRTCDEDPTGPGC